MQSSLFLNIGRFPIYNFVVILIMYFLKNQQIVIEEGNLSHAIEIAQQIPEFEKPYSKSDYEKRLHNIKHLILTAYINDNPVGFKIGYETPTKQNFYSWMGGILLTYRQFGIANKLAKHQENWARKLGYNRIILKTRSKHKTMIQFLNKHNFIKIGTLPHNPDEESRILYNKIL